MEVHWTRHIPQAMQRHTGCAWVRPAAADEPKNKTRGSEEPRAVISEDEKKAA